MENCDTLQRLSLTGVNVPGHLRPEALCGWLEQQGLVYSARASKAEASIPHVDVGPRFGLIHGTLSGLGFPVARPNLFEAPNWGWDKISCGEQGYGLQPGQCVLPADQLAGIFEERHPRVRALRMGTGSLYYLKDDLRLADKMPDGRISLWAGFTVGELCKRWREQFEAWANAGLDVRRVDLDVEIQKQWFHFYLLQAGSDWLSKQQEDHRWTDFARRYFPHFTKSDWDSFSKWGKDERATHWNAVAELRTLEYYGVLRATLREFWPDCVVGTSNGQFQDYLRFRGKTRRFQWGCGGTLGDYSSSKVYTEAELLEAESAVATSTKGYVCWLQDNPADRLKYPDKAAVWSEEGQCSTLHHALLLCGDLAPILSVDDGKPSLDAVDKTGRTALEVLSDKLKELDHWTDRRLGLPVPPEPNTSGTWRQTTIDAGNGLLRYISYDSLNAAPPDTIQGWRLLEVGRFGGWWAR